MENVNAASYWFADSSLAKVKHAVCVLECVCQDCHFDCISANCVHEQLLGSWYHQMKGSGPYCLRAKK